jgi:Mg2+ and Co2+ transporter CorA
MAEHTTPSKLYSTLIRDLKNYIDVVNAKYSRLQEWAKKNKHSHPNIAKQVEEIKDDIDCEIDNIERRIDDTEYLVTDLINDDIWNMICELEKDICQTQAQPLPTPEVKTDTSQTTKTITDQPQSKPPEPNKLFTDKSDEELLTYCMELEDEFDNLTEAVDHQNEPEKSILLKSIEKLQSRVNEDIKRIRTFLSVKNETDYYFIQSQESDGGSLNAVESLLGTLVIKD